MTAIIWKFGLNVNDSVAIKMPIGARILCVQTQNGAPQIWALVDPLAPQIDRNLRIVGTGHEFEYDPLGTYIGTFQLPGLGLVFHAFDQGESGTGYTQIN